MKFKLYLTVFLCTSINPFIICEDEYDKEPVSYTRFESYMGQAITFKDDRIVIKRGTFFSTKNELDVYSTDGKFLQTIEPKVPVYGYLTNGPEKGEIATYNEKGISLINIETKDVVAQFDTMAQDNFYYQSTYHFSDDGKSLVFSGRGATWDSTYHFDARNGRPTKVLQRGYSYINPEGTYAVSVPLIGRGEYARSFDIAKDKPLDPFKIGTDLTTCSKDASMLVSGVDDTQGQLIRNDIYDTKVGKHIGSIDIGSDWSFFTEQLSEDRRFLAQVTDSTIRIYNTSTQELVLTLEAEDGYLPFGLDFSEDNQKLYTVSNSSMGNSSESQKMLKRAQLAYKISKKGQEQFSTNSNPEEKGLITIWDINLDKPEEKKQSSGLLGWFGW